MDGNFRRWEIAREIVFIGESSKGFETDSSAYFGVLWMGMSDSEGVIFGDPRLRLCCHDDYPFTAPCSLA